ncbi:hypothetical protein [Paenirhodobacter sp. CAU 1674]|uniref:hypothetical protein n=1 Tax=Paenirhodobacter sp. CAU 1674 TaxID=3032596 RepID=UPI0023DAD09E|nr:hypothetical protein [Paenirhodobacter sp. CAU 1674]MDF2143224.1 hypothetical protein [Paenirhodobacter sp. CAU 1674]
MPDHQKYDGFSIALPVLFELFDICSSDCGAPVNILRIVKWVADHGMLAQPSDQAIKISVAPGVYPPPPTVDLRDLSPPIAQPDAEDIPAFLKPITEPISPEPPSSAGEAPPPDAAEPAADAPPIASAADAAPAVDRKGAPWSDEECRNAKRWRAEGLTARMIAERLGRPLAATQVKLSSLKDSPTPAKAPQKAPAAPVAKVAAPADKAAPTVAPITARAQTDAVRPGWWVELNAQLNALGYRDGWSAARDLELVEGLVGGSPAALVADQLGVEVGAVKARFIALTPDGVTIEGQTRLLQVLRARAEGK